jgi:hypothetical protein
VNFDKAMNEIRLQRFALTLGIAASAAGLVKVGLFPNGAPLPGEINPGSLEQLRGQGWKHQSTTQAVEGRDVSRGAGIVLLNDELKPSATATLVPVQTRAGQMLDGKRLNERLAANTQENLKLWRVGGDTLLLAHSPQQAAAAVTCIKDGHTGTTDFDLVDRELAKDGGTTLEQRLMIIAGLRRPRNLSCLWVRITSETTEGLQTAWRKLAPTLRGAY